MPPVGRKDRIVVKVGTSILIEENKMATERFENLCAFIADLRKEYQVILVTSAAVATGYMELKLDKSFMPNKQALASIGQPILMHRYYTEFKKYGLLCSQLLLGASDYDSRKRTRNAQNSMEVLLDNGVIPIINENDATALYEISCIDVFGDNDQNSAHVAHYFNAGLLLMLSDIEGLYDCNPRDNPDAKLRKVVHEIAEEEMSAVATPNNKFATGGIVTKLKAANFLLSHNRQSFLTSGYNLTTAREYLIEKKHNSGTLFTPKEVTE